MSKTIVSKEVKGQILNRIRDDLQRKQCLTAWLKWI
jgi:hypothetical protein